ncbi:MAG: Protein cbp3, mitochondrial, partial [Icmadophila ericetorum]|nr:Protein cbp3, mitochondrial [Icmadophila ericetorum]
TRKTYLLFTPARTRQFATTNSTCLQVIPETPFAQPPPPPSQSPPKPKPASAATSTSSPPSVKLPPKVSKPTPPNTPDISSSTVVKIAEEVRKRAPIVTETYVAYGITETLVKECARQADYKIVKDKDGQIPKTPDQEDLGVAVATDGYWYNQASLTPTFSTWAQITFLHMYLLTVRLRAFPSAHAPAWHQHMIDHFSYLAEERMVKDHGMHARMTRNKYLKDLFTQWRGLQAGYDEGLVRGDSWLAAAVWRNIFKGQGIGIEGRGGEMDFRRVGEVVAYMRSVLFELDHMEDADVASGDLVFGSPSDEAALVAKGSRGMNVLIQEGPAKYTRAAR